MDVAVLTHAMRVLSCASQVRSNAICVESRREGRLSGGISPLLISKFPNAGRALDSYFFKSFLRKSYNKVRIDQRQRGTNRVDGTFGRQFETGRRCGPCPASRHVFKGTSQTGTPALSPDRRGDSMRHCTGKSQILPMRPWSTHQEAWL